MLSDNSPKRMLYNSYSLNTLSRTNGDIHGKTQRMELSVHDKERCPECGLWKSKLRMCHHCMTRPNRQQAQEAMLRASMAAIPTPARPRSASCMSASVPEAQRPGLEQSVSQMDLMLLRAQAQTQARERDLYHKYRAEARYKAAVDRAVSSVPTDVSKEARDLANEMHDARKSALNSPPKNIAREMQEARHSLAQELLHDARHSLARHSLAEADLGLEREASATAAAAQRSAAAAKAAAEAVSPTRQPTTPTADDRRADRLLAQPDHAMTNRVLADAILSAMHLATQLQGEGRSRDAATVSSLVVAAQQLQISCDLA